MDIDKELYGHLPQYKLFSYHQSEWLNQDDWIRINNKIIRDYIIYLINNLENYSINKEFLERELKYIDEKKRFTFN